MAKKRKIQEVDEAQKGKEIIFVVDALANERDVKKDLIFEAIEAALAAVTAKKYVGDVLIRVAIDRQTGEHEAFRYWEVVADGEEPLELPDQQMFLSDAHEEYGDAIEVGNHVEEPAVAAEFGRIAAQHAKQVLLQKVREAERNKILEQYSKKIGELVIGIVKRVTHDFLVLDMGNNAEALLLRENMLPREMFRMNDRLRAYLYEVNEDKRGPQLLVSRTCSEFLTELFKIEVPEIGEEVVEIKAAARDAGSRAKIAVKTNDGRIDPIGACVGMRGSRVQAVSNELGGERIDIVLWDDNLAQLVINAMAPAEVASIVVDEDSASMDIAVTEDQLSQAIGRGGQNVRLASELSGCKLNIMTEADAVLKHEGEASRVKELFKEKLDVDDEIADALVAEGFTSLEEIAYMPPEEIQSIEEFDEEMITELQRRASDYLLIQEIADEGELSDQSPAQDLLDLEGVDEQMARCLASKGVVTRDDLADQAIDELQEIIEISNDDAAKLIMKAREHWFTDENEK